MATKELTWKDAIINDECVKDGGTIIYKFGRYRVLPPMVNSDGFTIHKTYPKTFKYDVLLLQGGIPYQEVMDIINKDIRLDKVLNKM